MWKIKDTSDRLNLYSWSLYFKNSWCASSANKQTLKNVLDRLNVKQYKEDTNNKFSVKHIQNITIKN